MAQERHKWDVLLAEAKVDHQQVLTLNATHAATNAETTQALSEA